MKGAKFWLKVCNELKNRDMFLIKTRKPSCLILRKYMGAESEEIALRNLESMQKDWKKYGAVLGSWLDKWDSLSTYFCYGYQTHAISKLGRNLRAVCD